MIAGAAPPPATPLSLGPAYPLEISANFHSALLHWLDSLANLLGPWATAGKTVEAHRATFRAALGEPSVADLRQLEAFLEVRSSFADRGADASALTGAFFDAPDLEGARRASRVLLEPREAEAFEASLAHFEGRYRRIWNEGQVTRDFLASADGAVTREALARFLVEVSGFYGVELPRESGPQLVLVPVADGYGTHAQAIGRHLLVEVRPGDLWRDQVAPIVHENAHYLFKRIAADRLAGLQAAAESAGNHGEEAWRALAEALPTAIAQGLAGSRLNTERWSKRHRWYHDDAIDAYAKRIYPLVRARFEQGRTLDAAFIAELARAW